MAQLQSLITALQARPDWAGVSALAAALGDHRLLSAAEQDAARDAIESAAIALLGPADSPGVFNVVPESFDVPRVLAAGVGPRRRADYWRVKQQQLATYLAAPDDKTLAVTIFTMVVCDAVAESPAEALARFLDRLITVGPKRFWASMPAEAEDIGRLLARAGCGDGNLDGIRKRLASITEMVLNGSAAKAWVLLVGRTFFTSAWPLPFVDAIFDDVVLPILGRAAQRLDRPLLDCARFLDEKIAVEYVKQSESLARYERISMAAGPVLAGIGAAARGVLGVTAAETDPGPDQSLRVGFVLNTDARLAHAEVLVTFLRGLKTLTPTPIAPTVYVSEAGDGQSPLAHEVQALGAKYVQRPDDTGHPMAWLRDMAVRDGVSAMVFVSIKAYLAFAAGFRVAPVVVWWSMKYQVQWVPEIDSYLTVGDFFQEWRMVRGKMWRACRAAYPPLVDDNPTVTRSAFRARFGLTEHDVVLACIGREEKMLDPAYLDAVAAIMTACPETRFIWTGRPVRSAEVAAELEQRGIAGRCRHLGWLDDTKAAARALDIFVDSFPFASGFTALEAMAAGKPVVVLRTPEAMESSSATSLVAAYDGLTGRPDEQAEVRRLYTDSDGRSLLPYVATIPEYIALAVRMSRDAAYRDRVGAAGRAYAERFARDERTFAATTCRHLIDIVREKQMANGGVLRF